MTLNYNIPEIQNKRKVLKNRDEVEFANESYYIDGYTKENGYLLKTISRKPNITVEGNGNQVILRKDLIFIPSIEWYRELMKLSIKEWCKQFVEFCECDYYGTMPYKSEQKIIEEHIKYVNSFSDKDKPLAFFMFKQGKILKDGKWKAMK